MSVQWVNTDCTLIVHWVYTECRFGARLNGWQLLKFRRFHHGLLTALKVVSVTTIKQARTSRDRAKIGPFFDFLLHFSIFWVEIFSIASQLSCDNMFKISSTNIEKCRRKTKKGPILVLSRLVLSCLIFVTVIIKV